MNLVEVYIIKIFYEKPYPTPKFDEQKRDQILVKYEYNCYGQVGYKKSIYPVDEWEEIKKKGYYWG